MSGLDYHKRTEKERGQICEEMLEFWRTLVKEDLIRAALDPGTSRAGIGAIRNNAIASAHYELLASANADDLWARGKLSRQPSPSRDHRMM